ncbi:MAG: DUF4340 domain-containing protein [Verrucomicrobia bacterium]|nr:DUF4340 domain-containing protein [Verrucomicrobiota bacterium]
MNTRNTWTILALAAGLFAFIFFYERHAFKKETPTNLVFPYLNTDAISSVQVSPAGVKEIRADRTNGNWQLTKPLVYPAQTALIENLLKALGQLTSQSPITAQELRNRSSTDAEFGFDNPQVSLTLQERDARRRILIGAPTALRDQFFLRVVGDERIYLVDANLLKLFPRQAEDWRDPSLVNLKGLAFDRLTATSGPRILELQREATNKTWRMTQPMRARADNPKIEDLLRKLQSLRASKFVTDDPTADLASFGLQPPELELAVAQGTNNLLVLQFGKTDTNETSMIHARRRDQNSVVLVPKAQLEPWRAQYTDFRDRYLVSLTAGSVRVVEARGNGSFTVQRQTNDTWRLTAPEVLPADAGLVRELLADLSGLQITEFTKDVVTELDFTNYGLASPARQYILKSGEVSEVAGATNAVIAQLDFGAVRDDKIYVRRSDESSVYAVKTRDYVRLPAAGWQLRDRHIWSFATNEVTRVTIRENGQVRQLLRNSSSQWSLAPGSQGIIDDVTMYAFEETLYRLGELTAAAWVDRGDQNRTRYGFSEKSLQIAIDVKNDDKLQTLTVEFGALAPSKFPYAAVTLDGQRWTFEFPWLLYQQILLHLTIPSGSTP